MQRTLASTRVSSRYWWLVGLIFGGIILAEIFYYHVFGLRGAIPAIFSIEDTVKAQGWWIDERKGVWIMGALVGVGVASKIVLKWQKL